MPGIGSKTASTLLDRTSGIHGLGALNEFEAPAKASEAWPAFRQLSKGSPPTPSSGPPTSSASAPGTSRTWSGSMKTRSPGLLTFAQLEQIAYGFPSRERFLTHLTLDPPESVSDESDAPHLDDDYAILSTIHSAKGQEYKSVFVLNVVDGCIHQTRCRHGGRH